MIPRIYLDTNIVLDLLTDRDPFYQSVLRLATLADLKKITLVVSPLTFATANYFIAKFENAFIAQEKLRKFRVLCEISDLNSDIIDKGLVSDFNDFEDALQYLCALNAQCEFLLTRNGKDFKSAIIPVLTVEEYLVIFNSSFNN